MRGGGRAETSGAGLGRSGADAAEALGEGFVKLQAGRRGQRRGLGIAEDLDGLLAGIDHHAAVLAFAEVLFNLRAKQRIEGLVKIIRELRNDGFALH
jgi:hypothetical protein